MFGSVTVRGYNGQEAIVETTGRTGIRATGPEGAEPPAGMHRIGGNNAGPGDHGREQHRQGVRWTIAFFARPTW